MHIPSARQAVEEEQVLQVVRVRGAPLVVRVRQARRARLVLRGVRVRQARLVLLEHLVRPVREELVETAGQSCLSQLRLSSDRELSLVKARQVPREVLRSTVLRVLQVPSVPSVPLGLLVQSVLLVMWVPQQVV